MRTIGVLEQARASFAQRSWGDAYAQFATADAATPLDLDDLEKLALAAYLTGHDEESTLAWTRAHHEAIRRDDPQRAARHAFLIGSGLMFRGRDRTGAGMVRARWTRAGRLRRVSRTGVAAHLERLCADVGRRRGGGAARLRRERRPSANASTTPTC